MSGNGRPQVKIFTDGACKGNPGPGGYAALLLCGDKRKEVAGGFRLTTNNRMEIMACIAALEKLRYPSVVTLTSDSRYVVDAMTKGWAKSWRAKGWKRGSNEPAQNPDLWERLLALCETHQVRFEWVRGHDGHEENEWCDGISVEWSNRDDLPPDPGYPPRGSR
ncbi:MAG: ribonuclease HI [Fimbriimonadaceae bacterium]|nr:ribonuclease HI [Fimbriimonadaceae bacterium]QYK58087.1 MAG: ribonuclease HI [Fimbriimonadaceae bacterium]